MDSDLPSDVALKMIERGALYPLADHQTFGINFRIVADEFDDWLEDLVLLNLNEFERKMYLDGYVAFLITDNGLLEWKSTGKQFPL